MLPRASAVCLLGVAALSCAPRTAPSHTRSDATARYATYLDSADRERWQKPDEVVGALGLGGGQTVVDLGAGTGYFAKRLAAAVGPSGRVEALDVDRDLLARLQDAVHAARIDNVRARIVAPDDPSLAPQSADLVFLCDTYNQLRDRNRYLTKLAGGLKPAGRIAIVDFHKREDVREGPAFADKVARETVIDEMRGAGFALEREEAFLPYQYFLVFRHASQYSFDPLVAAITDVMRSGDDARDKQWQVAALLSDYLQRDRLEERFRRPNPALPVTTYLLHADPQGQFSIAALVFQPHARTTVHDHQSWVVWGTLRGAERETRYRREDRPGASFPLLTPAWTRVFYAGEVSFIDPPPQDIHDVANTGDDVSVSLHVHATDISKQARNSYDTKHRVVRSFVQSYERAL
jgi:predicted metal-dependent enzyme (double-stranded beta helix superfamily)/ubiquinone/menaquinone biosynthesis C-methylase UbiE